MKLKYILIGLIATGASMFTACNSVIDLEPEFVLDGSQRFNNLDDYEFSLIGTYAQFRSTDYYGNASGPAGGFSTLPDMMSDNLTETGESLANFRQLVNFDYAADDVAIEDLWTAAYRIIAQANITLRGIDEFASENPGQYNRIKGQALAIRAYVHFDLLRYFGDDLDLNSTTLGVPYKQEFNLDNIARPTVAETWEGIFADLTAAKALLSDTDVPINSSGNFSLRANIDPITVDAILARAYLYSGQYPQAIAAATIVIDQVPLASRENFSAIWRDDNIGSTEVIWSLPFNSGEGTPASNVYFASGNRSSFRPSAEVLGEYDQVNDIRYSAYFRTNNNRTIVSKFLGKGSLSDGIVNWKVIRVSEMYLIRAEANTRIPGNNLNALRDLNTLRASRITGYVPTSLAGQALVDAIELERRKELFVEGHRFFDVKRTTRNLVRSDCGTNFTTCSLTAGNRAWAWPIPIGEIIANDLMSDADQNPGYN